MLKKTLIIFIALTIGLFSVNYCYASSEDIEKGKEMWAKYEGQIKPYCNDFIEFNGQVIGVGDYNSIRTSDDLLNWKLDYAVPHTNQYFLEHLYGVAAGKGKLVIAGTVIDTTGTYSPQGIIAVSEDYGKTWTRYDEQFKGYIDNLYSVAYGNNVFVVVGDRASVITSNDGINWTRRTINQVVLRKIVFENGRFVAVGDSGVVMMSTDGINWTKIQTPTNVQLNDAAFGNGWFVAVGNKGTVLRSIAALSSWEVGNIGDNGDLKTISYGNGVFVSGIGNNLRTSTDGLSWSKALRAAGDISPSGPLYASIYAKGKFVVSCATAAYYSKIAFEPPKSPSNLKAQGTSSSEIFLNWSDNSDNETHFIIWRKGETGGYKFLAYTDANENTFSDQGLASGKTYAYKVSAVNEYGYSQYSTGDEANTKIVLPVKIISPPMTTIIITAPKAPTNLKAKQGLGSSVNLQWEDNANNESVFKVERKTEDGKYSLLATLPANTAAYADTGLEYGETYLYRVNAFNYRGDSAFSNEASVTVNRLNYPGTILIELPQTIPPDIEYKLITEPQPAPEPQDTVVPEPDLPEPGNEPADSKIIVLKVDSKSYTLNGAALSLDAPPLIMNNRTVMPIRYIVEALGGQILWDATEQKITILLSGDTIELWVDSNRAIVNGTELKIDPDNAAVKPVIVPPGRTMIPVRFVAEKLRCTVEWNDTTREITITSR